MPSAPARRAARYDTKKLQKATAAGRQRALVKDTPLVIVDRAEDELGPAMRALTGMQRRFVLAYFHLGKREPALTAAGCASPPGSEALGATAYRIWHSPRVQAAIKEFADGQLVAGIPEAVGAIIEGVNGIGSKDAVAAAKVLLDRTMPVVQQHEVIHVREDHTSLLKEVLSLAKMLGKDPKELLGGGMAFIDADYKEVEAEPEPEPDGTEGLEDLL